MPLETLDDVNAILGQCCCAMPECPLPTTECESIQLERCGHVLPTHPDVAGCDRYTTKTTSYSYTLTGTFPNDPPPDDEWSNTVNATAQIVIDLIRNGEGEPECRTRYGQEATETEDSHYYSPESIFSGTWEYSSPLGEFTPEGFTNTINSYQTFSTSQEFPPDPPELDSGGPTEFFGFGFYDADPDETWTFIAPATFTKTVSVDGEFEDTTTTTTVVYSGEPADPFVEFTFPDDANGEVCAASLDCTYITKTRYRWVVPDTWTGSYFKVTWDILEEPVGWDDETPTVDRSFFLTDQTWEWTGPGDPEDADSWKSGWYEIAPPEDPGERRVVNIRFECYRCPLFGNKPQVTGEAVELPDP